jgi:hypothetical protein
MKSVLNCSGILICACVLSRSIPAADSAYTIKNDYVVVEAEDLPRSSNWVFSTTDNYPGAFTGKGYVRWNGPNQSCAALGKTEDEHHNDLTGACQGSPADWLKVLVYIERPGTYIMDLHNLHLQADGDNDVWTHIEGRAPPIFRVGSHHAGAFDWLSWGPPNQSSWTITVVPAVYTLYVAGRSRGFCVDRIAIYRKTGPNSWPAEAHYLSITASVRQPLPTVHTVVPGPRIEERLQGRSAAQRVDIHGRCTGADGHGILITYSRDTAPRTVLSRLP